MLLIHPSFDLECGVWFIDNIEAPTLKALKALLPPRTKIKDYYPNGFRAPAWPKGVGLTKGRLPINTISPIFARGAVKQSAPIIESQSIPQPKAKPRRRYQTTLNGDKAFQRRYNHNEILDLWAKGLTGPEIGRRLGLRASTTAAQIVNYYRGTDPRAVSRAQAKRKRI